MGKQSTPSQNRVEALLGCDPLTEALRTRIQEMIVTLVDAELTEVLAAVPYQRTGARRGYRHGSQWRSLTTGLGVQVINKDRDGPR